MKNKTVVIVGAAEDGIGEAVTRQFIADNFNVIGTFEPDKKVKASKLEKEFLSLEMVEVNHADKSSILSFSKYIKDREISSVVIVQMMFEMENPDNFSYDLWEKLVYVNLTMPNTIIHELKNNLNSDGAFVIVTSTEALMGSFGASAYASCKAAVHNLVKTHSNNLGPKGVRVNAVVPGWIGGVMDTDEVFNMSREITPLRRLGSPEEVAKACRFMVSNDASFITGTTLVVDGGYSGVDTISKFEFEAENKS